MDCVPLAKPLPSPRPVHRHKPIPTGEFGVYVNMLHENSNQGFKDEYEVNFMNFDLLVTFYTEYIVILQWKRHVNCCR